MKWGILAISFIVLMTGCNRYSSTIAFNPNAAPSDAPPSGPLSPDVLTNPEDNLPETFEVPDDFKDSDNGELPTEPAEPPANKPSKPTKPKADKPTPAKPAPTPASPKPDAPAKPDLADSAASKLIYNAERVMNLEGKSIGTACNKYVARVLEVSGFQRGSFLANDFDLYAKKNISSYRVLDFERNANGSEVERLKRHLWSYPERTAFIMQWSRAGVYGHIALVERIGEKLVIYQASLNSHTARKDQTTVNILLSGYNRRVLSVYSELIP